ncbi:hypothetical protein DBV33_08110 [Pseudomonas fluorescens]|nr:hypothetical protein DBV33_08110 [Pseudomonas fluorescens]
MFRQAGLSRQVRQGDAALIRPHVPCLIVPTLRVGMPQWTLCVRFGRDAERPGLHSHAERGNDHGEG